MIAALVLFQVSQPTIELPAFTGYFVADPHGARLTDDGRFASWTSRDTQIEWGGYVASTGSLQVGLKVDLPAGETATYDLVVGSMHLRTTVHGQGEPTVADFGAGNIVNPQWVKFVVRGVDRSGPTFGEGLALELDGSATVNARFNLKPRRNAASVHLWYPVGDDTEWFYNEVTAQEDPVGTYYMACGFSRGYFGMQVNGPNERRIIFSVWDSGNEAVDRSKVDPSNQVQVFAKGPDVYASGFGNEGTGGHSHLVYPWRTGEPQKFIVHGEPRGDHTIYTGYFWDAAKGTWRLIASFSAPHDGHRLTGLYSFVEDFDGENGHLFRKAYYGPAWIHTSARGWEPLVTAQFTHDGTGGKDRFDYDFGLVGERYFLQNGGFTGNSPQAGARVHIDKPSAPSPNIDLGALEKMAE